MEEDEVEATCGIMIVCERETNEEEPKELNFGKEKEWMRTKKQWDAKMKGSYGLSRRGKWE